MNELTEKQVKGAVEDYLRYKMNLGELYFDQLFTGEAIETRGETRRKIQGCRAGTADLFVLMEGRIIFLEIKSTVGRLRTEQKCFKTMVESFGAEYYVVRDVEELRLIMEQIF